MNDGSLQGRISRTKCIISLPIAERCDHRHDSVRRPRAYEEEEDREGHLGNPHLGASLLILGRERLDVHFFRLDRMNKIAKLSNSRLLKFGKVLPTMILKTCLLSQHFLVSSHGFDQLRVEVDDEYHWKAIRPRENRGDEHFGVLVVAEKIEAAGREETLCND